jgi:hypothetical protein
MQTKLTFSLLAVLLTLLALPAITQAEEAFFPACIEAPYPSTFPKAPEECAQEHQAAEKKAAEEAVKAAEEAAKIAAKTAEEQAPAPVLAVKVFSHHGDSFAEPGVTAISVNSTPYVRVTFRSDHGMGTSRFRLLPGNEGITEPIETGAVYNTYPIKGDHGVVAGAAGINMAWSCHLRGQTIHFTVRALGGSGAPLVHTGSFKIGLSARWCAAAKQTENSENARHRAEERKEAAEHVRHEREKRQHEVERFETNCRAIGGIPVEISTSEGRRTVCHSKTGGVIPVPN